MKLRTIIAAPIAIVAAGLLLSGCGQATRSPAPRRSPRRPRPPLLPAAPSPPRGQRTTAAPAAVAQVGTFGQVLVGANGNTLYAFTKDVDGVSTCFDACAAAWPAVIVTPGFTPPAGVDPSLVTTVDRPDGSKQLKIGKWPLYFYAGDGGPGETNGQGVGGVWFVEGADGTLIKGDAPAAQAPAPQAAPQRRLPARAGSPRRPRPIPPPGGRPGPGRQPRRGDGRRERPHPVRIHRRPGEAEQLLRRLRQGLATADRAGGFTITGIAGLRCLGDRPAGRHQAAGDGQVGALLLLR